MKGMNQMMKQAQKLQARMLKVQEELAARNVEAAAGGGVVRVTVNGAQPPQVVKVAIEREELDLDDMEMLEDLVQAAVNEGLRQAHQMVADEMGRLTGGLSIPGLT